MLTRVSFLIIVVLAFISCKDFRGEVHVVESPDRLNAFSLHENKKTGEIFYKVHRGNKKIVDSSFLGFKFNKFKFENGFKLVSKEFLSADTTWEPVWGQKKYIRDNYNQLTLYLKQRNTGIELQFVARAYNDGIAFRYIFPAQEEMDSLIILDELTEFNLPGESISWWIPAMRPDKYELLYMKSSIDSIELVHTPFTCKLEDSMHISIHEADLENYSSMALKGKDNGRLEAELIPWKDGTKVKSRLPFETPWRTIQISETAGGLIESDLILNLNKPNELVDVSWIQPMKYVGIWWGIHIHKYSFQQGPKHGATTENAMRYIDFAAQHGFDEVLVEGWNEGWEGTWYKSFGKNMDFTTPTPDFDLFRVQEYAKSKGVTLQAYTETCANTENFLNQIDTAFSLYHSLGYKSVKIGQVGPHFYNGEYHHGQYGVNYYRKVIEKAAEYQLSVNFHEPMKPTGESRTFPNMLTREGARGQEYNSAWSKKPNPPEHTCILPFTRLLGGAMDFTPGIFNIDGYHEVNQVNTTLAKQLALYVVIYSPVQMAADLPENYEGHPAFQFIKDVPVDWDTTIVLNGEIGEYVTIARKDKNSEDWYLGSITNKKTRDFTIDLSFLTEGERYLAQIYADTEQSDYRTNPEKYNIYIKQVNNIMKMNLELAPGGGQAIRFKLLDK